MTTCRCCGQYINALTVRAPSSSTIWVDEGLLACCNDAYAEAEARGAAEVEVAHLVWAIATHRAYRLSLERYDLRPAVLAEATRAAMLQTPHAERAIQPRTSRDLKILIDRARREADARGVGSATLDDCLRALLYDCHDLACGRQIARWCVEARRVAPGRADQPVSYRAPAEPRVPFESSSRGLAPRGDVERFGSTDFEARQDGFGRGFTTPKHRDQPQHWDPEPQRAVVPAPRSFDVAGRSRIETEILERLARQERLLASVGEQLAARDAAGERRTSQRAVRRRASAPLADEASPLSSPPADVAGHAAALVHADIVKRPPPPPPAPSAPIVQRLKLRDRLRRGSWLQRPGRADGVLHDARAVTERSERGPMLSLVQTQSQERMSAPRASADLGDDEDDTVALEDDGNDEVAENGERVKRFYLALDDEIVRAPSIGPKTAARIIPHGIVRVRDLLGTDARKLAARIGARHITVERIVLWQDQARLVCTVPWLRGTHAQILVGAGFNTVRKILAAEPIVVCAAIRIFATTREGQRVLRAGPPPDDARVFRWVAHAQVAEAERAA